MTGVRAFVAAVALALPVSAAAQQVDRFPVERFRKWDIGGGLGIRFGERDDAVVPAGSWMAEGSRYWTPHFKTSIAVTTAGQSTSYGYSPDPRAAFSTYGERRTSPSAYGFTAGYQFFDNEFVHPYVTAGARFASAHDIITVQSNKFPYESVITSTPEKLEVRPVVGGGFKSYFDNGQAFMRSEVLIAVGPNGARNVVLQVGWGVDF
jgi:hypothetical protein